ncbi:anti-sigma factor domain-containing protein [Microlunatus capsulatus]|uniref:Regulator of SigK n=1 Tax=Microlunatus capsulatus TaxID=99117 RepID=A0ABS4Z6U1_9ACTN|nr:anti-sigma factor [Microlunatus capsulatus]MBP2416684.1 anti-sigma-K factor RskA [Microlunatus capsulatus]
MSEIHGATGSYVLHALDADELEEFEAHLAVCPTCSREVVEFCETAAELSLLASAPPPPALKGSVMSAISGVRVLPPDVPAEDQGPVVEAVDDEPVVAAAPVTRVDELALRRQRRLTRVLSLAVAAALVVALGLGGWVVSLTQRETPVATSTLETELLNAPDVKGYTVPLSGGGQATFVASKTLGRALFSSGDLPALPADKTYQLWTLSGSLTDPGVITPDNIVSGGGTAKSWLRGPVAQSGALAVSVEPAGGSQTPTDIRGGTNL